MVNIFRNKSFLATLVALCLFLSAIVWRHSGKEDQVALIDGAVITMQQLDNSLARQLSQLNQQIYNLKRQKLEQLIDAQLLTEAAERRRVSVETLLEREVNNQIPQVSEAEIQNFYENNKQRLNRELNGIHDQIRDYLNDQKIVARKSEYFKTLRAKAKVTTYLKPPAIHRANVLISNAHLRGEETAPVTIIKFEDFECPFCKAVQPTLEELMKKYPGKIRIFHKDLPLEELHPKAQLAAEATRCAGDQGRFWQYHDTLYHNAPKFGPADLKAYAKDVRLDSAAFAQCLGSGKYKSAVHDDFNEGAKLGLTGTPTFFINGREMSGALSLETFATVIDEELAQAR
jgi:protein-disulfide isomerase